MSEFIEKAREMRIRIMQANPGFDKEAYIAAALSECQTPGNARGVGESGAGV